MLVGSLATPLYDPLSAGRDDSWFVVVLLGGAHLGIGVVVRGAWVLLLPGGWASAGSSRRRGWPGWLIVLVELPLLVGVTALGWVLAGRLGRRATVVAAAAFVVAALPARRPLVRSWRLDVVERHRDATTGTLRAGRPVP